MSRAEEISRRVATEVRLSKTGDFTNYATGLCQSGPMSEEGQDIAEYAVMLAVILIIVVGTIRLIGSNANTVFSQTASSIQ